MLFFPIRNTGTCVTFVSYWPKILMNFCEIVFLIFSIHHDEFLFRALMRWNVQYRKFVRLRLSSVLIAHIINSGANCKGCSNWCHHRFSWRNNLQITTNLPSCDIYCKLNKLYFIRRPNFFFCLFCFCQLGNVKAYDSTRTFIFK